MPSDNLNVDQITEARRKAIAASIRPITVGELKALGETLFPFIDHPWRDALFSFIDENPGVTYYQASAGEGIQVIYCPSKEKGLWFQPGSGMGPMQPKGLKILKQIVEGPQTA